MRKFKSRQIIDVETGEMKEVVSYRTLGQAIGFEKKKIREEANRDYEALTGRNFSFFKTDAVQDYINCMDEEHLKVFGAVMMLSTYLPMNGTGKLPQPTQEEISKAIGLELRQTKEIIKKALELKLIIKNDGGYYMNADVIYRGVSDDSRGTVKSFHKAMRAIKGDIKLQHIGLLFLIMPYISFDHYIVCKNANTADLEHIQGMTTKELGKEVGLSRSTIERKMKVMTFEYNNKTMSVFAYFINPITGKKLIIVNPALFSRTNTDSWKNLINLFILSR